MTDGLDAVRSLAEDEVLRGLDNLSAAALRTNFYQRPERPVISIKVESRKVEGMPSPRPMFEIYVHSRLLEGIHLRGGKVARGGIRWSDRHDDFRTEILGLMKTQMVKNSIIVPVGSKGGFVLKGNVPPRPALDAYLIDRYREFVSGLLDVTDNLVDGKVLHPPEVVRQRRRRPVPGGRRRQGHRAPLRHRQQRLGPVRLLAGRRVRVGRQRRLRPQEDGHHGARRLGVREAPLPQPGPGHPEGAVHDGRHRRHVRRRVRQRRPAVAVTKLVAAFNHVHIFIDPEPDPEKTYGERERLFNLPRSTLADYDACSSARAAASSTAPPRPSRCRRR